MKRARWLALLFAVGCQGVKVGDACKMHPDCAAIPEGYCARVEICTRVCDDVTPCPSGALCSAQGARQVCLPTCSKDSDCLKGFVCAAEGACVFPTLFNEPAAEKQ